jgi:hypothetical protein
MIDPPLEHSERIPLAISPNRKARIQSFSDRYGAEEVRLSACDHIRRCLKKHLTALTCLTLMNSLLEKVPLIRCLKQYHVRRNLLGDIFAGITVAILHIPQGRQSFIIEADWMEVLINCSCL